jgi:hypothetical protein
MLQAEKGRQPGFLAVLLPDMADAVLDVSD